MTSCDLTASAAGQTVVSEVLQGAALRLNCSTSSSLGCAAVDRASPTAATWFFAAAEVRPDAAAPARPTAIAPSKQPDSDYLTTRNNDLVVLSADGRHSGDYTCLIDGRTFARHRVRVLRT